MKVMHKSTDCKSIIQGYESSEEIIHRLEVMNQVARTVIGQQDLDTVLSFVLDKIMEMVECKISAVLLLDRESGSLYYRAFKGQSRLNLTDCRVPVGKSLAGKVFESGEPILINDDSFDAADVPLEFEQIEHLRTFAGMPLKRGQEVVGVLVAARAGDFNVDELSMLSLFSEYLTAPVIRYIVDAKISKGMARYRALLQYALGAQEEERKRVARELHDETSQALTSLTFHLQAAIHTAETRGFGDSEFIDSLKKAHSNAVHTGTEIVNLMMDLRPTLLDDLGMTAAILKYARDTLEPKGIHVVSKFQKSKHRLSTEVEVACFRVAQGLISNILRHSEAKNVWISVEYAENRAILSIKDDGKGFDVNKITDIEPNGRGAGLFTMRERLRLVGGNGVIKSKPGRGTKITVTVPIVLDLKDITDEQDPADNS